MGVTVMIGLMVWLAGSYLEFKIISGIPALKPLFRGIPGVVISLAIGAVVGWALAIGGEPAGGAGIMLGQLLGVATNEQTFRFWSLMHKLGERKRALSAQRTQFMTSHPKLYNEAKGTLIAGFKTIGAIVLAVVWLIGLPYRTYQHAQAQVQKVRHAWK